METQFLSAEKASLLEDSISFLSNYEGPEEGVEHVIGNSLEEVEVGRTELLRELGELNKRRKWLIETIKK